MSATSVILQNKNNSVAGITASTPTIPDPPIASPRLELKTSLFKRKP